MVLVLCLVLGIFALVKEWRGTRSCAIKCISVFALLFPLFALWTVFFSTLERKEKVPRDAWMALRKPQRVVLYFPVCYECGGIVVFRDGDEVFSGSTGGSAGVLNSLLTDAKVALPQE